jgi:CelD/BcsL family acetyltransferase involved in cellulose biosynthesis
VKSVKLSAYNQVTVFEELRPEWNELLQRSTSNQVFSTWEWQSTWWEAYNPGQLWVIACRDDENRLVGLAPWFIENHPTKGRVVRSIGCVEVTDYLDIIVDKSFIEPILNCIASYINAHTHLFDLLDLCNIPEHSPNLDRFANFLRNHGFEVAITQQEVCPIIELPDTWEEYLARLNKKDRHELRRKVRRAEGETDWYIVNGKHNLDKELERFLGLMSASHPAKAGFLDDSQNITFFKNIVPIAHENGWLQLSFLNINEQAVAAYLNFDYNNHILVYNSGLLPGEYSYLSPGIVLIAHNIRRAIETGHTVFDFLRGNEDYKYRLGGKDTRVFMLKAHQSIN